MKVIKDLTTLNAFGKKHHLTFDRKFKYCNSNAYKNDIGEDIPHRMEYKNKQYELKYFSGCFHPFLIQIED